MKNLSKLKKNIAIVFGSKGVNATGLIRSLGMSGANVVYASSYSPIQSKFLKGYLKLSEDKSKWLKTIVDYCESLEDKPVVFPCDDESAYFLDDNYDRLKEVCLFSNAKGKVRFLSDKTVMAEMAAACGVLVPEFVKINIAKETEIPLEPPVILKPYAAFAGSKGDIRICRTKDDLNSAVVRFRQIGYSELMVQKLLESPTQHEIGLMGMSLPDGTVVIPGTINKIRSYPVDRGSTSYARFEQGVSCVDKDKLADFVRSTGYVGLFDIEMIVDNQKAWFIEINFRNGQYGFIPTVAGYNLVGNWFKGINGFKIDEIGSLKEVYYINEREDYLHTKTGLITKKEWKKQFRGAQVHGMFCKGDQMPFIRQFVKIPDRVIIFFKKIVARMKDVFLAEEWTLAIREVNGPCLFEEGGEDAPFKLLKNSIRYWAADPFLISNGDKDYIFFEMFDRLKRKGVIGYREIKNGKIGKMKVAYESEKHLSFPFLFNYKNEFYMIPESSLERTIKMLKAKKFPCEWETVKQLISDQRFCDSIVFEHNDNVYMFTQKIEGTYNFEDLTAFKKQGEQWLPLGINPVVHDAKRARMAGNIILHNGELIRVGQDCSENYGEAITFSKIINFTDSQYVETPFKQVFAKRINLINGQNNFDGIHTYNKNNRYEIVDFKTSDRFSLTTVFGVLKNRLFER